MTGLNTLGDVVEYVKAIIDPDLMITGMTLNGEGIAEDAWQAPLKQLEGMQFAVSTGHVQDYLTERFQNSAAFVEQIRAEFNRSRGLFADGVQEDANRELARAVEDLNAFVNWYDSLLNLVQEDEWKSHIGAFQSHVGDLAKTCDVLVKQQLEHSWWALGETMTSVLEPQLDSLQKECEQFANSWQ